MLGQWVVEVNREFARYHLSKIFLSNWIHCCYCPGGFREVAELSSSADCERHRLKACSIDEEAYGMAEAVPCYESHFFGSAALGYARNQ